ncbi:MAG TPA: phosphate ABC transporter permease subunit PstC [Ruminiclostridium sp.]|nr:phosphate ABC transporter permease subunit PstC [Ruminiclostridium sp.]
MEAALAPKKKTGLSYEKAIELIFAVSAFLMIFSVIIICVYIFIEGVPPILEVGISKFIFGTEWTPTYKVPHYGILPMILASVYGMAGAIIIGVPIGIFTAVMLAEIAPKRIAGILKSAIELLAGIPSVVYGFFGLTVIVPFIRVHLGSPTGTSLLAMIIILSIMVLPTIVNITETSLRAVPREYKEGSLALGASKMETIFKVMIPAARSGIVSSVILGMGRALGETMAVIMVCGNLPNMPKSLLSTVSPMTAAIAKDMSYAGPFHQSALFGIGVVLFVFIVLLNLVLNLIASKSASK